MRLKVMIIMKGPPRLTVDVANPENTTEFSQWDTGWFVDIETTDDEKHALSMRCWLLEKQYMFPDVGRGNIKALF